MYVNKLEYERLKQVYEVTKSAFNLANEVTGTSIIVGHDIYGEINGVKWYLNATLKFTERLLNAYKENISN